MTKTTFQAALVRVLHLYDPTRLVPRTHGFGAREQQGAKDGRHGQRDHQRRKKRDKVGETQRPKQPALDAVEEEQGDEDEADHQRGEHDRAADLAAAAIDHVQDGTTLAFRPHAVFSQSTENVLDVDDRIVDDRPDGNRHPAERHAVDRGARRLHGQHGGHQ